jgi:2-iminobutanoate/2-iminopropanoate deaminase
MRAGERAMTRISAPEAPRPGGAYSQAVEVNGWVFVSGQTPRDSSRRLVGGDFEAQARQALRNLQTIAEAAGLTLRNAVRVTVYLDDMQKSSAFDSVYREFVAEPWPARTIIQSSLAVPVEVDAILVRQ